jgi:hypothetical protein
MLSRPPTARFCNMARWLAPLTGAAVVSFTEVRSKQGPQLGVVPGNANANANARTGYVCVFGTRKRENKREGRRRTGTRLKLESYR